MGVALLLAQLTTSFKLQNFTFPRLEFFRSSGQSVAPQLKKMDKLQVEPIQTEMKPNLHLIEFLLLDMDFDFADTVPRYERMIYKFPDI